MKILVTGGASGLGAAIVKTLAADGAHTVFFTYARSTEAAKEITTAYPNTQAIHCDFTNASSVGIFIKRIPELDIDALVNNANSSLNKQHFYKTNPEVFLDSFTHNIMPVLKITQEAIKVFRKKKFGKIINIISSYVVNKPPTGLSEYVANKAYMLSMSNSWASENIKANITSNCISPSFMLTGLTSDTDERIIEQMTEEHPLKKLLSTNEAAEAVLFFIKASQQINAVNLVINAGADIV